MAGATHNVRVTFSGLAYTSDPVRGGSAPGAEAGSSADRFERDTLDILKRLSRHPIDPGPTSELLADLGFDSLQVLELIAELEDRFDISIPLNDVPATRTVAQVVAQVTRLVEDRSKD